MKKYWVLFFLTFFCFYDVIAQPTDEQIRQAANTLGIPYLDLRNFVQSYQNNTSSEGVIIVDAVTLHQAYQSNRVRADNMYREKTLRISGVIYEINRDYINFKGPDISVGWVSVYFNSTELQKIANLEIGHTATFIGIGDSGSGYVERVRNATLVLE